MLVNARITKKSFYRWRLIKNYSKKIFEKIDLCIASDKQSENYLKILGSKNVKNFGNLKFAKLQSDVDDKLNPNFLSKIKNRTIWCAASTHPSEELFCANPLNAQNTTQKYSDNHNTKAHKPKQKN